MTRAKSRSRLAAPTMLTVLVATGVGAMLTYVETKLEPLSSAAGDRYGISVAVDGPVAAIGANGDDTNASNAGAVWISERGPAGWSAPVTVKGTLFDGELGEAVAVSGTSVLVGAADQSAGDTRSGAAYVIVKNGASWLEEAKLVPSDPGRLHHFGFSVDIDGDTAVVGAIGEEEVDYAGAAYVFQRSGGVWSQVAMLPAPSAHRGDLFGWRVAIDGDRLAVSARYDQPAGAVYVFQGGGSSWTQEARLVLPRIDLSTDCCFGDALALSGDTLVVGTDYKVPVGGVANVFRRTGSSWTEEAELTALDTDENYFASSLAIDGDTLVVGADGFDQAVPNQGGAYVYTRSGTTWTAEGRIQPADGLSSDAFGHAVALSGDALVVGAFQRLGSRGAAYVFELGSGSPDIDGDGIENAVDTIPAASSDAFSDSALGGTTTGSITDRAGLDVSIAEAANPDGVLASASGVGGPATVDACGIDTFLSPGDSAVLTCGSLTMEVLSGPIEAAFEGPGGMATVSVGAGNVITIDAETFRVTADPDNPDTIVVMVGGGSVDVPPGATVPLPGAPSTTTTTATTTSTTSPTASTTTTTTPGSTTTTTLVACGATDVQCGVDHTREVLSALTCTRRCRCQRLERGVTKVERKLEKATSAPKEKKCLRKLRQVDKAAGKLDRKTAKVLDKGCAEPAATADALREAVTALTGQTAALLLETEVCLRP